MNRPSNRRNLSAIVEHPRTGNYARSWPEAVLTAPDIVCLFQGQKRTCQGAQRSLDCPKNMHKLDSMVTGIPVLQREFDHSAQSTKH
jgi:hypothetical protein